MKRNIVFVIVLLGLVFCHYSVLGENKVDEQEVRELLGEAYIMTEDYESAEAEYRKILEEDPKNIDTRIGLADILSWQKKFDEAIPLYKKILESKDDPRVKAKLADVLSWDKQYEKAIELYDKILDEEENEKVRLKKARVLGWTRKYSQSLKEYQRILDTKYNKMVELEMEAKKAYWGDRVKQTIHSYKGLIKEDPKNVEAMFDLSQIYSHQSMWQDAIEEYERILEIYPGHFRAREGLEKADLISEHLLSKSGYVFLEADSPNRDNDIRRHSIFEKLSFPLNNNFRLNARYELGFRNFEDFNDVVENSGRIGVEYRKNPDWWTEGFYNIFVYDKDIKAMHNFGGKLNCRVFDMGISSLSYERRRLENNSTVIREHYYQDRIKERVYLDITKRLKIGADYLFSYYSDDNFKNEPAFDILYYLSLEPMRFSVKYRYFYREFNDKVSEYFSPKGFSTNRITLNWRHFLNKEEIFFGADDLYYDLKYAIAIDSEDIVGHKFSGEFNWDINKRFNFNIQGSITNSSADVYKDKSLTASIKYYF